MKTDDLISLLSHDVQPVDPHVVRRRFSLGLVLGAIVSVLMTLKMFGLRPDIDVMLRTPLFWIKLAFPAAIGLGALLTVVRLCRPGLSLAARWTPSAVSLSALWIGAAFTYFSAPIALQPNLLFGLSWRVCPFNIAVLSIPTFAAAFWAVRGMAPVRLRLTGACAGLLASSIATLGYCLHCPEMGVPFWAVWYVLGMAIPTAVGALLGPTILRW